MGLGWVAMNFGSAWLVIVASKGRWGIRDKDSSNFANNEDAFVRAS